MRARFQVVIGVMLLAAGPTALESQKRAPLVVASASPEPGVKPGPEQSEIVVTFRGGEIDDNIVAFYAHLRKIGALPTKQVEVKGVGMEDALFRENILFAYYPAHFNALLADLNKTNSEVRFTASSKNATMEPVYGLGTTKVTVPDLQLKEYPYYEIIQLDGQPLSTVAAKRHLHRDFDAENPASVSSAGDAKMRAELTRLNARGQTSKNPWHQSEGRVVFPAEGFVTRLLVPTVLLKQVLAFSRPNVSIVQAAMPALKSMTVGATSAGQPGEASLTCPEPFSATFNEHLKSITYRLPKNLGLDDLDDPSIFIVDRFPPFSETRKRELQFIKDARALDESAAGITPDQRSVLLKKASELGMTEARANELITLVSEGEVSDRRYDLSDHLEFRESAGQIAPRIVDPNSQDFDKKLDHGIHVSGIISARCNSYGIAGMVPFALPKAYSLGRSLPEVLPFEALNDLIATYNCGQNSQKPCIINLSWVDTRQGLGPEFVDILTNFTLEYLFVVAAGDQAGNMGPNNRLLGGPLGEACDILPACFGSLPNVITVTGSSNSSPNTLHPEANYNGRNQRIVTIAAPGEGVLSTIRGSNFASLSGTSQAAAFVTGAAGLLEAANHRLDPAQIKNRLLYTADLDFDYDGKVAFGKLNVERALAHHAEDVVSTGEDAPKTGIFDYALSSDSRKANRELLLFRNGRQGPTDRITDVKISRVRRIWREANGLYTVVYVGLDNNELKIVRHVTFEPAGQAGHRGAWMTKSFVLNSCATPRDEDTPARDWWGRCPQASREVTPINLAQISDLIVNATASVGPIR